MQAIGGYTWPGIEYGEPPSCMYTFFEVRRAALWRLPPPALLLPDRCSPNPLVQYVDALRTGDVRRFEAVEAACHGWWFPGLDRGAGAALHFAVDHGQVRGGDPLLLFGVPTLPSPVPSLSSLWAAGAAATRPTPYRLVCPSLPPPPPT